MPIVYRGWKLQVTVTADAVAVEVGDEAGIDGAKLVLGGVDFPLHAGARFSVEP
jgi:hypothetical protein